MLTRLKDDMSVWHEEEELNLVITKHFKEVFATSSHCGLTDFIEPLAELVSEEINSNLARDFIAKKVYDAFQ